MEKRVKKIIINKDSTGKVAMTRGAKKTSEKESESRCDHSPPTTEGKFRINLPLLHSPHTCTHKQPASSNAV